MTRRHIQPKRWTIQWSQNIRDLVGQLHRFERLTYDSLSSVATEIIQQVDSVTGLNLGSGSRVFVDRLNQYLRFRTIRGDDGVSVTENADGLHIDVVSTIAGANVGSGADVFRDKTGGDTLNFRGINGINGISTVVSGDNVDVDGAALQLTFQGFDGVDLDEDSQVVTGRRSRQRAFLEPDEDIIDQAGWGAIDEIDLYPQVDGLSFHSLVAPGADDTTEMVVRNRSTTISITIPHESTEGLALYRFACPQLQGYVLAPGESVKIKYASNAPARWWVTDRATASGIEIEPRAGLGALGRFWRIQYGNDEDPPTPGTEYEMVFVPGRNEWIKIYLSGAVGPAYLHAEGSLNVQRLQDIGEAGETTAAPNDVSYGGFISEADGGTFTITGLPPGMLYASPLRSEIVPGETPRILVTYGRNDSGGSSSTRIMRSDDGGFTWATGNFANASQLGALCLRWTGENVVAAFEDGTIEYSTDRGQTFSDASSPTGQPLRVPISNGEGTVVLVAHGSGVYSTDHGVTWTASSFPIAFTVRGGAYFEGVWYIFTADNEVLTSLDGVTWTLKGTLDLRCPGWEDVRLLDTQRGLFVCADHIVGLFVDDDTEDYYKKDFFWTRDGVSWTRSWSFGEGPGVIGPQQDSPFNRFPWRVRVHCSSAQSPAHLEPPWHQIVVVPATGDIGQGGLADVYIGPRDYGGAVAQVEHAEVAAAQSAPVPVGGVAAIGIDNSEYALPDHRHDTGTKGSDVASASTINLDTATGDYVHVTGTTTITAITLASGIRREVIFDGALTLEYSANLLLESGEDETTEAGELWLFRGEGSSVVRGWRLGASGSGEGITVGYTHGGDTGAPGDGEFVLTASEFRASASSLDRGNIGLAVLARMTRGGFVPLRRVANGVENMELHVGPPTNEVDYLSFPVLDRFQTFSAFAVSALQVETDYLQLSAQTWQDVDISPDGRHMLLARSTGDIIEQHYLLTPWRPDTRILVNEYVTTALDTTPTSVRWSPTGERVYWTGSTNSRIFQFNCAAPYQMFDGADSGESVDLSGQGTTPLGLVVSADETSFFVVFSTDSAYRYDGTAADPSSFSYASDTVSLATVTGVSSEFHGMHLAADEETLFVTSSGAAGASQVHRIALASAMTLAGATLDSSSADLQSADTDFRGITVSPDGQYFVIVGATNDRVYRFNTHALTEDVTYRVGFLPGDEASHRDYPLVFEDDATYGHYMEALVDVSWLPDDCIVAARFAASVGVSEGDTDDIGTTGDYGDLALFGFFTFTKNGGALARVSHIGFWHPAYTDSPGTGGEQFIDVGYNEMTTPDLTIESGKLRAAVSIDGTGVYAGLALVGTMRVFFDSVTVRGELPAP